jgi:serine/threonine-protein kinase
MTDPRTSALLAALSLFLSTSPAHGSDPAAAQALFDEARRLLAQGQADRACPKFEESQRLDPGLGTQFHLADCWQQLGRKATAWSLFKEVAREAHALGQSARERVARDRAEALAPWIPKLAIAPRDAAATPGFSLLRDGAAVEPASFGVPVPVDPGPHEIAAQAPGKQPWIFQVDVAPDQTLVTVNVPALVDAPPSPPPVSANAQARPLLPPRPTPVVKGVTAVMPEDRVVTPAGDAQRAVGWTIAGLGLATFAAGTYYGIRWIDDFDRANSRCSPSCDAAGAGFRNDARAEGTAAAGLVGGGVAAMLIGAAVVVSAPDDVRVVHRASAGDDATTALAGRAHAAPPASVRIVPTAAPSGAGVVVLGTW